MSNRQPTPLVTAASPEVGRATGFELASPGQPNAAAGIGSALERNRAFAANGGHQGAVVFANLRLFVITCLDPRVGPAHFLDLDLSDAMVVRNVGGRSPRGSSTASPSSANSPRTRCPTARCSKSPSSTTPNAEPERSPTTPSATATPSGSAPTNRPCASTPSSTPRRPSPATSSASAPHPQSPRASECPGTSTTSSPAWRKRSSPQTTGTIVMCADGQWSHSGGHSGACSGHGGEFAPGSGGQPPSSGWLDSTAGDPSAPKTVHVQGYTRKDGTYVAPYDRRPPCTYC
jgi:hypothetical protein